MEEHGLYRKVTVEGRSGVSLFILGECIFTVPDRAPRRRRPAGRASRAVSLGKDGLSTPATRHIYCRLQLEDNSLSVIRKVV